MVLLTVTVAAKDAIDEFRSSKLNNNDGAGPEIQGRELSSLEIGSPIEHGCLVEISSHLVRRSRQNGDDLKRWRLDSLLKGASVYQPPPPSKPEPVSLPFAFRTHPLLT